MSAQWYFNAKTTKPVVCDYNEAAQNCAASCQSQQECFRGIPPEEKIYFAWDRIRLVVPAHVNGSLCLGQDLKKNDIVQECKTWMASMSPGTLKDRFPSESIRMGPGVSDDDTKRDRDLYHWLRMNYPKFGSYNLMAALGPHVNITDCEQLEKAIDGSCSFDTKPVQDFTNEMKTSDGWSIGFWVKPTGFKSLDGNGKFVPGLSLLHSISPPEPLFGMGKFSGDTTYAGLYTGSNWPYTESEPWEEDWAYDATAKTPTSAGGGFSSVLIKCLSVKKRRSTLKQHLT